MSQPSPTPAREACKQCQQPAAVKFTWPTSTGPQSALLCRECAATWWKQYQHTAAGNGLSIAEISGVA